MSAGTSPWELPTSLDVGGVGYAIRSDFRDALYLLGIFADPAYEPDEQGAICLQVLYEDWEAIPAERQGEALEQAVAFLDGNMAAEHGRRRPRTVDWEQDGGMIVAAVNKVLGQEIRALPYLHWWTFLGAYMEIGESLFTTVVGIRQKRAKGKKLEKHEQEFVRENRALVTLRKRQTEAEAAAEQARRAELKKLFV